VAYIPKACQPVKGKSALLLLIMVAPPTCGDIVHLGDIDPPHRMVKVSPDVVTDDDGVVPV